MIPFLVLMPAVCFVSAMHLEPIATNDRDSTRYGDWRETLREFGQEGQTKVSASPEPQGCGFIAQHDGAKAADASKNSTTGPNETVRQQFMKGQTKLQRRRKPKTDAHHQTMWHSLIEYFRQLFDHQTR